MSDRPNIECSHCGSQRDPDLRKPCEVCKSRNIFPLGYSYGIEAKHFKLTLTVIIIIFILALSVGAIYLLLRFQELDSAISAFLMSDTIFSLQYLLQIG